MPALTLTNLFLYAAQAALVIGALAALFAALRLSPAFRLAACRAVLLALLVLPWQALVRTPAPELPPVSLVGATPGFVDAIDARVPGGHALGRDRRWRGRRRRRAAAPVARRRPACGSRA